MENSHNRKTEPTLAERLAPMAIGEIEKMTDREIGELMGASRDEVAAHPWAWREAAKAGTDEYAERVIAAIKARTARSSGGSVREGSDSS